VSKFLRLTDTQFFLLRHCAAGIFINEMDAGFAAAIDSRVTEGASSSQALTCSYRAGPHEGASLISL